MSKRVAMNYIKVSSPTEISIEGQLVTVINAGKKLSHEVHSDVKIFNDDNGLYFKPAETAKNWALAGTSRALVANMIEGLEKGFSIDLDLVGVGYRVKQDGRKLIFTLGYSHPINFELPELVDAKIEKQTELKLTSIDKQLVGQVAANIISLRKPDSYKGKGVRRRGQKLKLKEVKKK